MPVRISGPFVSRKKESQIGFQLLHGIALGIVLLFCSSQSRSPWEIEQGNVIIPFSTNFSLTLCRTCFGPMVQNNFYSSIVLSTFYFYFTCSAVNKCSDNIRSSDCILNNNRIQIFIKFRASLELLWLCFYFYLHGRCSLFASSHCFL